MQEMASRKRIFNKTNGRCFYCGCGLDIDDFHMDHFYPKSKGGKANYENLVPSCPFCNLRKRDLSIEGFRNKLSVFFKEKIVFYFEDENLEIPEPPKPSPNKRFLMHLRLVETHPVQEEHKKVQKEHKKVQEKNKEDSDNDPKLELYFKKLVSKNIEELRKTQRIGGDTDRRVN